MRISAEAQRVSIAQTELEIAIDKFQDEHDLSDIEVMQALNSYVAGKLKFMLRYERHGNYDTPAMIDKD